jgi:hypothetical protein
MFLKGSRTSETPLINASDLSVLTGNPDYNLCGEVFSTFRHLQHNL